MIAMLGEQSAALGQLQRATVDPSETEKWFVLCACLPLFLPSFRVMVLLFLHVESTCSLPLRSHLSLPYFSLESAKLKEVEVKHTCIKLMLIWILMELGTGAMYTINPLNPCLRIINIILMINFRDSLTFNVIHMQFLLKPLCLINLKRKETILTRSKGKMIAFMHVKNNNRRIASYWDPSFHWE